VQAGNKISLTIFQTSRRPPTSAGWLTLSIIVGLSLSVPLVLILYRVFLPGTGAWHHIVETLLFQYTANSLLLCFFTGTIALVIGVSAAWLISRYHFPGKRWMEWALILPLALPSYIVAYSYAGLLSYTGPVYNIIRNLAGAETAQMLYFDSMNIGTLSVTLGLVLFPYVYLPAKAAFQLQSASVFEAAASLSDRPFYNFRRIALPLARPAIAGGLFLVLMEVLNDYGAVKYFGINTFTTGIFKAWFSMGDLEAAIKLSAVLMLVVGLLFLAEKRIQRSRFASSTGMKYSAVTKVTGARKWLYFLICFVPFFLGFALPFIKIITDALSTWNNVSNTRFLNTVFNSVVLAGIASTLIVVLSILFIYSGRINGSLAGKIVKRVVSLGYALPGAVIAVGVMVVAAGGDRFLDWVMALASGSSGSTLIIAGSITGLIYAYLIRFMAVSVNPLEGNFEQQCNHLDEASVSLGKSRLYTLFRVNIPVLKPAILSAFLLVFVDVMKELPLTLILRPFNFNTLATTAFEYANDEMLRESAPASLLIVLSGIVPILLIHQLIKQR
jgi:iron(III) transport system permease protein